MEAAAEAPVPVELSHDLLRELAELRPERGLVVSMYLDLDPSEFATADARSSAVTSLVDGARRKAEAADGLDHDTLKELRKDIEGAAALLQGAVDPDAGRVDGARALALFCCTAESLLRVVRLRHGVSQGFRIDRRPWVGPLTEAPPSNWCVLLADRRRARVFVGGSGGLRELGAIEDDVHGQHDQGGWSQARYQRSVDQDARRHFEHVGEVLRRELGGGQVEAVLIGGPDEVRSEVEEQLRPELRERVAGHFNADVEASTADAVLDAAASVIEEAERRHVDERLDRLREGSAHGTGALGLRDVLTALNERAVETLILERGHRAAGKECPSCGWLVIEEDAPQSCPADGTELEPRDDIVESAVRLAVEQSAAVLHLPQERAELGPLGGVAAILRFAVRPEAGS